MIALPYDYFLIVWFVLAGLFSAAEVNGYPPLWMRWRSRSTHFRFRRTKARDCTNCSKP
jgi:hypothetical protein